MDKSIRRLLVLLASGLVAGACQTGPAMTPGEDCNSCHRQGGNARAFTVSGTVFPRIDATAGEGIAGVQVVITDADGQKMTLESNAAGNFYTDQAVRFPIAAEVHQGNAIRHMQPTVETGACSSCHDQPPHNGAEGRVFASPTASPTGVTP